MSPIEQRRLRILSGLLTIYIVWGSTYLGIRTTLQTLPPFISASLRFLAAGPLLYAWARWRGAPKPTARQWRSAFIIGGLMLVGGNGGVVFAQQHVPSGVAALVISTIPLWMVLLDWRLNGKNPTAGMWMGMALGAAGIGALIGPDAARHTGAIEPVWALVLLGAALSWAIGTLLTRRLDLPDSGPLMTGMQMIAGGTLLASIAGLHGEPAHFSFSQVSAASWCALAYLVIVGSIIGFSAYFWLLRQTSIATVSTYAFVNPLIAVALGCLLAGEPLTPRTLIAAALIIPGVALIVRFRR